MLEWFRLPPSSFLSGMASVLDLGGTLADYPLPTDEESFASDQEAIVADL